MPLDSLIKPIKVCHIAHGDLWAGAEAHLATLLEGLRDYVRFNFTVVLFNEGRLALELRSLGMSVVVLREDRHGPFRTLCSLIKLMKETAPDIIHTHKYKDNILGCIAAAVAGVPKVVRIVHGMVEPFTGKEYVKMVAYETLDGLAIRSKVNTLIAVSANIESRLAKKYGADRVVRIHNGINLDRVRITEPRQSVRDRLGVSTGTYLIGTVGRLTAVKGHEFLLRVASLPRGSSRSVQYLIVGDGPLMSTLRALAVHLGIEKQVLFLGHREDIYDLIHSMDAFVLPSLHEGIPMVLLEALALSRPVVASRVGGIPEVIEHGVSGLLVEPGDPTALHGALNKLMQDQSYADRLGQCGRKMVEQEYSATLMVRRTAELYSSLTP